MSESTETEVALDVELVFAKYRGAIARRNGAKTPERRAEFQEFANDLRQKWRDWKGEDSLDEMAFWEFSG